MVLHGNLSFLDKLIKATNLVYADQINGRFLRIIVGNQISNIHLSFNPFSAVGVLRALSLIDFTLSNARRFYSPMENPLGVKGLLKK